MRQKMIDLQLKYCLEKDLLVSMPLSGFCKCGYDLVDHFGDHLGKQHVQGCPKCNRRYSFILEDHSSILSVTKQVKPTQSRKKDYDTWEAFRERFNRIY